MGGSQVSSTALTPSRRLWMAFVLGALSAFGPLSIDMYLPSLPILASGLHTSTSLAQLSLTACLLGLALGQLVVGPLSDARGRRKPLLAALIVYAISSILCAFSSSIWMLIILRFLQGLAGSAGIVLSRAIVRDLYSGSELTRFFSLLMLINGAAPILAPIIGGQLLRVISWHGVFIVLCAVGLLMLVSVFFGLPETLRSENRSQGGLRDTLFTFRKLASDRSFMGYAWSQGLVTAAMFAYIAGSPFVLQTIFGVSPQTFSLIFATNGLGIIISSQIGGLLAGRVPERKLLASGLGVASVCGILLLICIYSESGIVPLLIFLFGIVSCIGIVGTTSFSLAMQSQSRSAGSASALLGLLPLILGSLAAPLVGIGGSHTALPMGIIIAVCDVGSVLCFALLVIQKRPYLK
ncbi:multidrug effflux MFS transporter [Aneurinibacillus sp. Ricciae_BoGa-3]|uniref:multidrug effflux MFS transporter n=1 Tax=Aneurinibacillus sp. Ricciae_BoGa-3 TaxID=3022697 RepID=UPI00233FFBC6|nr:multidrug effflux MFS transporter [Aneurinibacillus sp. Ricciae_BoGa-3]WCK52830.1 multidrug effflux MFS transporter [Aneurinibacillus sp. Ricciae_BoGa-3]